MPNEILTLAFDEARAALKEQDATLNGLRNRATGLLAAASVGTSFAASIGFLNADPGKGPAFPVWAGWSLLPLTVLIGAAVMAILWPTKDWSFGLTPQRILDAIDEDPDAVRRTATMAMIRAAEGNQKVIQFRMRAYRGAVAVLLLETAVLVLALVIGRR